MFHEVEDFVFEHVRLYFGQLVWTLLTYDTFELSSVEVQIQNDPFGYR